MKVEIITSGFRGDNHLLEKLKAFPEEYWIETSLRYKTISYAKQTLKHWENDPDRIDIRIDEKENSVIIRSKLRKNNFFINVRDIYELLSIVAENNLYLCSEIVNEETPLESSEHYLFTLYSYNYFDQE